ncbi:MAG TPA: hypothetical protein VGL65_03195 [Gemmatimonadales bacterium]
MPPRAMTSGEHAALVGLGIGVVAGVMLGLAFDQHNPLRLLGAGVAIGLPLAVVAALLFGKGSPAP